MKPSFESCVLSALLLIIKFMDLSETVNLIPWALVLIPIAFSFLLKLLLVLIGLTFFRKEIVAKLKEEVNSPITPKKSKFQTKLDEYLKTK